MWIHVSQESINIYGAKVWIERSQSYPKIKIIWCILCMCSIFHVTIHAWLWGCPCIIIHQRSKIKDKHVPIFSSIYIFLPIFFTSLVYIFSFPFILYIPKWVTEDECRLAGKYLLELLKMDLKPRDIITRKSTMQWLYLCTLWIY